MEEQSIEQIRKIITETVRKTLEHGEQNTPKTKPEHMTSLRGDTLVNKGHPRIALRGRLDSLEAEIILFQVQVAKEGLYTLYNDLDEIIAVIRRMIRCEVSGEPVGEFTLQGMDAKDLREHSHHPSKFYGMRHFLPTAEHGEIVGKLNRLRTLARETELAGYHAFRDGDTVSREDILQVLNRLSSLFWIMMFKYLTGCYVESELIEVEASGRHVHLSRGDVEELFGSGYQLTRDRNLSQPGQFACKERISIIGPKGTIQNVAILGPERKETQVEISFTDGRILGITPPIRQSGDLNGSIGVILEHQGQKITLTQGVIVAQRHMHVSMTDANKMKLKDGELINVEVKGSRPVILENTLVRVSKDYATYLHIDYDEANACGFVKGTKCRILGRNVNEHQ